MATKLFQKAILLSFFLVISLSIFGQTIPPAPTGLRVTATECGKISLAWDAYVPQTGILSFYFISRSTSENGVFNNVGSTNSSILTFDDNGAYSDLFAGQPYYYKISAFISLPMGNSINTELSNSVITTIACPTPPTLQISTSNCTRPVLSWADFPSQYVETGYQIWRQENNQDFNRVASVGANILTYTDVSELIDGINYTYELRGVFNNKVITLPSNKIINNYQCTVNNNFRVSESICGKIKLDWDNNPNFNVTEYNLAMANGNYNNYSSFNNLYIPQNIFSYEVVQSLKPSQNVYFKLKTKINSNIYTERQIVATSFNCSVPNGLHVTNSTCSSVSLAWNQMPINTNHTKFYIFRGNKYKLGLGTKIGEVNATETSFTDNFTNGETIISGEEIYYTITALTENTQSTSSLQAIAILNCPIPQNVQALSTDCQKIDITWTDYSAGIIESGYKIYRSESNQNYFQPIGVVQANVLAFSDLSELENGKSYVYKVEGIFNNYISSKQSIQSNIVQFNCLLNNSLQVVNVECGKIEIGWVNPPNLVYNSMQIMVREKNSQRQVYNTSISNSSSSFTFLFGQENVEYQFSILYSNNIKISSNTVEAFFNACPVPTNLRVISADCGKISLEWDDFPSQFNETGYKIVAYDLLYPGQITEIGTVGPNITNFDILGVNYFSVAQSLISKNFRIGVKGLFNYTNTLTSNLVSTGFDCEAVSPNAQLISASCGSIKIGWNDIANFQETGYEILRAEKSIGLYYNIGNVSANILEYTDNGYLAAGVEYSYKIKARFNGNLVDAGSSVTASFTCPIPSGIRITQNDCDKIKIEWDDFAPEIQESSYQLYYSYNKPADANGGYYYVGANTTSFITSSRPNETIYFYLAAKFNNSVSNFSNSISTILNCPIQNHDFGLRITSNTCEGVKLEWNKLTSNNVVSNITLERYTLNASGAQTSSLNLYFDNSVLYYNDLGNNITLNTGETYYYRIRAIIDNKVIINEPITNIFTCNGNINLSVTNGTNCNGPTLSWSNNSPNFPIEKYIIKRGAEIIGYTEANVFSFVDSGFSYDNGSESLLSNQNYNYTVSAFNSNFNIKSNIAIGQYSCGSNITLTNTPNCNKIALNWVDNDNNITVDAYEIFMSSIFEGYPPYKIAEVTGNQFNYETNFEIQESKAYKFLISKRIGNMLTDFSNELTVSINCKNEPILAISNTGCRYITINFNDNNIEIPDKITVYRSYDGMNGYMIPIANLEGSVSTYTDYSTRFSNILQNYTNFLAEDYNFTYQVIFHYGNIQTGFQTSIDASFQCSASQLITGINGTIEKCESLKLEWNPLNIDSGPYDGITYYIYRSDDGINGEFKNIAFLNSNTYSNEKYIDKNSLVTGKTYFYKIQYLANQLFSKLSEPFEIKFDSYKMNTIQSGPWKAPTTWSCGRIPTSLDEITINPSHIITLEENVIGNAKNLINNGQLIFGTGGKLEIELTINQPFFPNK